MARLLNKIPHLLFGLAVMQLSNATTFNLHCRYLFNDLKTKEITEDAITYHKYFEPKDSAKSIKLFDKLRDQEISVYEFSRSDAENALKICDKNFNDNNLTRTLISFEPRVDDVSSFISNNSVSSMFYSLTSSLKNFVKQANKPGFPVVFKDDDNYVRLVEYTNYDVLFSNEEKLPLAKIYEFLKKAKQENSEDLIIKSSVKSFVDRVLQKTYRLVTDKNKAMEASKFLQAVDLFTQGTLQAKLVGKNLGMKLYATSSFNSQNTYLIDHMNLFPMGYWGTTEQDIVQNSSSLIINELKKVDLSQPGKSYKFVTNLVVNSVFISHIVPVTITVDTQNSRIKVKIVDSMLTSFNSEKETIAEALVNALIRGLPALKNYKIDINVVYSKLQVAGTVDCARFTSIGILAELLDIDYENMPPLLVYKLLDMYSLDSNKEKGEVLYGAKTVLTMSGK